MARSGQSIWTNTPALVTASYSTRIASAIAYTYSSRVA